MTSLFTMPPLVLPELWPQWTFEQQYEWEESERSRREAMCITWSADLDSVVWEISDCKSGGLAPPRVWGRGHHAVVFPSDLTCEPCSASTAQFNSARWGGILRRRTQYDLPKRLGAAKDPWAQVRAAIEHVYPLAFTDAQWQKMTGGPDAPCVVATVGPVIEQVNKMGPKPTETLLLESDTLRSWWDTDPHIPPSAWNLSPSTPPAVTVPSKPQTATVDDPVVLRMRGPDLDVRMQAEHWRLPDLTVNLNAVLLHAPVHVLRALTYNHGHILMPVPPSKTPSTDPERLANELDPQWAAGLHPDVAHLLAQVPQGEVSWTCSAQHVGAWLLNYRPSALLHLALINTLTLVGHDMGHWPTPVSDLSEPDAGLAALKVYLSRKNDISDGGGPLTAQYDHLLRLLWTSLVLTVPGDTTLADLAGQNDLLASVCSGPTFERASAYVAAGVQPGEAREWKMSGEPVDIAALEVLVALRSRKAR